MKERDKGMTQGLCIAAAYLIRERDEPTFAKEILDAAGLHTLQQFEEAEVDDYDLKEIKRIIK